MNFMPDSDSEDELPPGWEERATGDGDVYYVHRETKITQYTHPRTGRAKRVAGDLPFGWEKKFDVDTKRYVFYNAATQQTTNMDPRLAFAAEEPPMSVDKVRQRFDSCSTALQVLHGKDLHGRVAFITGSNCGIGYETACSLAMHGCEVIFACRNRASTVAAIETLANQRPATRARCHFIPLDLSSLQAVRQCAEETKQSVTHIDFLILNAGIMGLPYTKTADGLETTFQVSHLSHFYLTLQLESLLDHNSRVIVLSSESHRFANLPAEHLSEQNLSPSPDKYWSMMAYNNAKLCNVLFAQELANRWKERGISVFSVHPGNMVPTELSRYWWFYRWLFALIRPFTKSLQQAAATTVYCATANELTGLSGLYFNNCYFCEPSKLSQNAKMSAQLWQLSENIVAQILEHSKQQHNVIY